MSLLGCSEMCSFIVLSIPGNILLTDLTYDACHERLYTCSDQTPVTTHVSMISLPKLADQLSFPMDKQAFLFEQAHAYKVIMLPHGASAPEQSKDLHISVQQT